MAHSSSINTEFRFRGDDHPMLDIRYDVNPYGLEYNCYYCTLAGLKRTNVNAVVDKTEIMQQDGADFKHSAELFNAARLPVRNRFQFHSVAELTAFLRKSLRQGQTVAVPLHWNHPGNTLGHMVALQAELTRNNVLQIMLIDFQRPPNHPSRVTYEIPQSNYYCLFDIT